MIRELKKIANDLDKLGAFALADDVDEIVFKLASEDTRANVFLHLLACTRALAAVAQSYHWRTKGGHFYSDHLLFERIYNEINDMIDGVAEKGIGVSGDDSFAEVNKQTQLVAEYAKKHSPEDIKEDKFAESLLDYMKDHIKMIAKMLEKLKETNELSDGIENMFQGMSDTHESHVYLLQRRIKEGNH